MDEGFTFPEVPKTGTINFILEKLDNYDINNLLNESFNTPA